MVLSVNNISKYFGVETLFENITFNINEGDKAGLIGVNGAGKSTLFKIITGELSSDGGSVIFGKDCKVGYMSQYLNADKSADVFTEALSVSAHLTQLEQAVEDVNLSIEIGDGDITALTNRQHFLNEQYERLGGFTYKSRTRAALVGLGFSEDDLLKKVSVLSGGEKVRLQIAKLLMSGSDILLLDEPANHLDITSMQWLEDYLTSFSGSVIVISHDRYFLDRVTNRTLEIENKRIISYNGNYSVFMQKKAEARAAAEAKYENTVTEIKRIEGIIEQQHRWNRERNIKTAESKQKSVDRLKETLEKPTEQPDEIRFEFEESKTSGNDVLYAENLKAAFDGRKIFDGASLDIKRGERIFLLGPNGCGKTTLLKLLLGEYPLPENSLLRFGTNVEIGYYDQSQSDLDEKKTVIDEIWDAYPQKTQTQLRNACAAFLFCGDDVFKDISVLSGGEKARVSLLKLMLSGSNFLMLDEPTNHLDIASREALEASFASYGGTMLIISHDRYFINKLADKIFYLTPHGVEVYAGNYEYYLEKVKAGEKPSKRQSAKTNDYKQQKALAAAQRKLQSDVKKCEQAIETLETEIAALQAEISSPEAAADYKLLAEKSVEIDEKKQQLDEMYLNWETLSGKLESEQYEDLQN